MLAALSRVLLATIIFTVGVVLITAHMGGRQLGMVITFLYGIPVFFLSFLWYAVPSFRVRVYTPLVLSGLIVLFALPLGSWKIGSSDFNFLVDLVLLGCVISLHQYLLPRRD